MIVGSWPRPRKTYSSARMPMPGHRLADVGEQEDRDAHRPARAGDEHAEWAP